MKGSEVYDDPTFLHGYRELRRTGLGLNDELEIPAMDAVLPPVDGLRVVDLGCGEGGLAVGLAESGAADVTAWMPRNRCWRRPSGIPPCAMSVRIWRSTTTNPHRRISW